MKLAFDTGRTDPVKRNVVLKQLAEGEVKQVKALT
jgi:hypothetical protein